MNLASHHLRALEAVGLVERRVSEGDRRRRYVVLRRDALNGLLLPQAALAPAGLVLFVCTHNSARSQFAAGLWRLRTGNDAASAGSEPSAKVHPQAVRVGGPQRCRSPRCRSSRVRRGRRRACVRGIGVRPRPRGGNPVRRAGRALVGSRPGRGPAARPRSRRPSPRSRSASNRWRQPGPPRGSRSAPHDERPAPDRHQRLRPDGPARAARRLGSRRHGVRARQRDRRRTRHGRAPARVRLGPRPLAAGDRGAAGAIRIDGELSAGRESATPGDVAWGELRVDVVLECTGRFRTRESLEPYLAHGVRKVVVAAPVKDGSALNIVVGVNDDRYDPDMHRVVTAASCTTNCLAPVVKVLHEGIGIRHGSITTLHDLTNTQTIVDAPHKDLRRARAAGDVADPDHDRLGDRDRPDLSGARGQARRPRGARAAAQRVADRLRVRDGARDDRGGSQRPAARRGRGARWRGSSATRSGRSSRSTT